MTSWSKTLQFREPLRDLVPSRSAPASAGVAEAREEELRTAYESGRVDGEKALGEQLVRQRGEMRQLLEGVVESLRKSVPQVVSDTEQHLISLALEIAQKLVTDLPISVEMVETAVRDALSQVEGTSEIHVRLHPADMSLLESMGSFLLVPPGEGPAVGFHSSPEVTRGGCLVQTRFGIVDARRETKLDLLKRSMLG